MNVRNIQLKGRFSQKYRPHVIDFICQLGGTVDGSDGTVDDKVGLERFKVITDVIGPSKGKLLAVGGEHGDLTFCLALEVME